MNAQALIWWISALAKRLGLWGLLGLCLLVLSAFIYWIKVPAILNEIAAVEQAQVSLDQQREAKKQAQATNPAKQDALAATVFFDRFKSLKAVPALLKDLHKLAKQRQLALEVGDYRYQKAKSQRNENGLLLTQYKMIFPVEGRYTDIRRFIDDALAQNPEMALLDLQVVREDRHTNVVAARLVFAVYVKVINEPR